MTRPSGQIEEVKLPNHVHPRHIQWLAAEVLGPRPPASPGIGSNAFLARRFYYGRLLSELEAFGEIFVQHRKIPPSLEQMQAYHGFVVRALGGRGLSTCDQLIVTEERFASIMDALASGGWLRGPETWWRRILQIMQGRTVCKRRINKISAA